MRTIVSPVPGRLCRRGQWHGTIGKPPSLTRGYRSRKARLQAIESLTARGYNYFVCYRDVKSKHALTASTAAWVPAGQRYVNW